MMPFAFAVLAAEIWVMRRLTRPREQQSAVGLEAAGRHGRPASRLEPDGETPRTTMRSVPVAVSLTLAVLLAAGVGYRSLEGWIDSALNRSLTLRQPLSSLPFQFGTWEGQDRQLEEAVRRLTGDDDYICRTYLNQAQSRSIDLYVGYVGRPRFRMGHRPDICYPSQGFEKVSEARMLVAGRAGSQTPVLLYEFRRPGVNSGPRELVVAAYIINGEFVVDPGAVDRYNIRGPGLLGRQIAYVARIQASVQASGDENADAALLSDFTAQIIGPIMAIMPSVAEPLRHRNDTGS
jgi:EpsI family protein